MSPSDSRLIENGAAEYRNHRLLVHDLTPNAERVGPAWGKKEFPYLGIASIESDRSSMCAKAWPFEANGVSERKGAHGRGDGSMALGWWNDPLHVPKRLRFFTGVFGLISFVWAVLFAEAIGLPSVCA